LIRVEFFGDDEYFSQQLKAGVDIGGGLDLSFLVPDDVCRHA
jgi:hypothetical protein